MEGVEMSKRLFGVPRGELYSGYGDYRPNAPAQPVHAGWDVGAPTGTPGRALGVGEVVRVRDYGSVSGYNQEITVFYESAICYVLYGHAQKGIAWSVGDSFAKGDLLARIGTQADAMNTAPHFHIQAWKTRDAMLGYRNDLAIDPARVARWYAQNRGT